MAFTPQDSNRQKLGYGRGGVVLLMEEQDETNNIDGHTTKDTPLRYVSLDRVYSNFPTVRASGGSTKEVEARKVAPAKSPVRFVYSRRSRRGGPAERPSLFESLLARHCESVPKAKTVEIETADCDEVTNSKKKRKIGNGELLKLGVDMSVLCGLDGPRLRDCRNHSVNSNVKVGNQKRKKRDANKGLPSSATSKRWVRLSYDDVNPKSFIGLQCKVFWPFDVEWYSGNVSAYNPETNHHQVEYEDGDAEDLILSNEKVKFHISPEEMEHLNLTSNVKSLDCEEYDYNEMVALAATLDDCQELEAGDIVWAKLTGHAMWPAIVVDELLVGGRKGLKNIPGGKSVPVQFFGTHDFARIKPKQVISFLKGLLSSFHLKCKKPGFAQSLEEAKVYLSEQKLPRRMLQLANGVDANRSENAISKDENSDTDDDCVRLQGVDRTSTLFTSPYIMGDLQIISLGKIVKDSKYFQDDKFIWPEGYTALRKFTSISDPSVCTLYKMEVLRHADSKVRPLFRVTLDKGEEFKGSTPSSCWNKIYKRIRKVQNSTDGLSAEGGVKKKYASGSFMFGFSNPKVKKLIEGLLKSRPSSKLSMCKSTSGRYRVLPAGYRPVRVQWKDLDKCSVCHMDEEYESNLFLQCDKCRIMVHAKCYGELEPVDDVLWLCNLCRPGAPDSLPPCCLCPVIGGAMKPTTDGRWAHLACAMWIPETCLLDVKKMEPVDGISRIHKDRWKLLCSICGVSYGACIQCSNSTCRVAYHPLCARAAGLCVELEDEDRLNVLSIDEDDDNQCIRLYSFCKKHRQPSNGRLLIDERFRGVSVRCSDYLPPVNPSGCARGEPYNQKGRRGRKEPEALAAASLKRLFVENQPYLVGGHSQRGSTDSTVPSNGAASSNFSSGLYRLMGPQLDAPKNILSMVEKYNYMRETFRKRLAFGKSGIHGFGIFTKHPHRAGDMVIEYIGEVVRPSIADRREHFIYNSLVPNCYSRVITVNGDEHIIIFAKRDIKCGEELTYDYRFFSIDEQLACYCGFPRCRGVVNDVEAKERETKIYAPRRELIYLRGE
ncbi:histone-lysine N-methyltransferase ATX2-like [Tripterygium wilfordii]|uniref:Histone-lysine N-methyltransferase ATX2-like n=1 Tax=Tripterygium wilfordii TaxID=458696 RepID=A0A7J7D8Q5_TRIWF|nr:histone-lysine N-methyltransferase ATX2-like [Tripterygium wilfordii]